ncbi:MAG TPA: Ig-like domain-containing protein [Bacteroidales bacterium]|jgi:hypothetical protein|nr:hypothetical protein [Bacteroidales bacterium]OQC57955.1 MAG: hypothetical protein BWX52_00615 [Bacteroidetes bacterium ADurb.Bin013]MCZ2316965.1 Ig-like domain-containing protein [Bacteroidales bacterium]HNZ46507.1 Ig-like domain-containing protein [Bacteroidales bacterium]HOD55788.1 Ig-like domain-containing protein [Bacteroidales bacterium]
MKRLFHHGFMAAAIVLFALSLLTPQSCANTTAAPAGGPKDTIPPVLIATLPDINQTHVSTSLKKVELRFNEYVKITDANKNIMLSPPPQKNPTVRTKGKGIVVELEDELKPNTTYSLYFGNSIQDNNEGNPFPVFALGFSTGEQVDSLMYSGLVLDASTLLPVENTTVVLHINPVDTTISRTLPVAATRTDAYGYFVLRNLKDTLYSLFAMTDQNNNYRYSQTEGEQIGFLDTLIRPHKRMFTYAPEIQPYYLTDTAGLLRRPVEGNVFLFKEVSARQSLRDYKRIQPRALELKFGAPFPTIISAQIPGIDSTQIIRQHNYYRDSLVWWLAAPSVPDTVLLHLTYMATVDSLNKLLPRTDTLRFTPYVDEKAANREKDMAATGRGRGEKQQAPPSVKPGREVMSINVSAVPERIPDQGIVVRFKSLPIGPDFSLAQLVRITAKEDTVTVPFTVEPDSLDLCLYRIIPATYMESTQYLFSIPSDAFRDVYGLPNDSLQTSFKTLLRDDFGALNLQLENVPNPLIVDLMNEGRNQVLRTSRIASDSTITYPYLKAGKYTVRITEDMNGNGYWDTGNIMERKQAERVRMFRLPSGNPVIDLAEKMELTQIIDIEQLLNQHVSLSVPVKRR